MDFLRFENVMFYGNFRLINNHTYDIVFDSRIDGNDVPILYALAPVMLYRFDSDTNTHIFFIDEKIDIKGDY